MSGNYAIKHVVFWLDFLLGDLTLVTEPLGTSFLLCATKMTSAIR